MLVYEPRVLVPVIFIASVISLGLHADGQSYEIKSIPILMGILHLFLESLSPDIDDGVCTH